MPKASVKSFIGVWIYKRIEFVLDIEKYPEFVPFCQGSKVHEREQKGDLTLIVADLTIGKGPFIDTYKSDVKFNKKDDTIFVTNVDGPLNYLENNWKFVEQGDLTEVTFDVDFEIKNSFLNILMTKSFQFGLEKIADAFQKKAESL
jgi:coenzyme Q-binding protein COQ10